MHPWNPVSLSPISQENLSINPAMERSTNKCTDPWMGIAFIIHGSRASEPFDLDCKISTLISVCQSSILMNFVMVTLTVVRSDSIKHREPLHATPFSDRKRGGESTDSSMIPRSPPNPKAATRTLDLQAQN